MPTMAAILTPHSTPPASYGALAGNTAGFLQLTVQLVPTKTRLVRDLAQSLQLRPL